MSTKTRRYANSVHPFWRLLAALDVPFASQLLTVTLLAIVALFIGAAIDLANLLQLLPDPASRAPSTDNPFLAPPGPAPETTTTGFWEIFLILTPILVFPTVVYMLALEFVQRSIVAAVERVERANA